MEEQQGIVSQVFQRNCDDIASARKPCVSVSHTAFGLKAPGP